MPDSVMLCSPPVHDVLYQNLLVVYCTNGGGYSVNVIGSKFYRKLLCIFDYECDMVMSELYIWLF